MTEVIARVHSIHLVNVEQRQAAADPQTKPHDLGCESACLDDVLIVNAFCQKSYGYRSRWSDTNKLID